MSNPNNFFPDETNGTQSAEVNSPIPELPTKLSPQQQPEYSSTLPDNESSTQSLEVGESPITGREEALTIRFAIGKLNDYLLWFLMVLEVTLLIEFFLMLIGAALNNLFAGFMYALTVIPLYPFNGIVPSTKLGTCGNAVIEWSTLIAMVVYFLVFYALRQFLSILISSAEDELAEADVEVIRSAINSTSYSNYQQLTKAIIHRISATDGRLIEDSSFVRNTVWEISLPSIGLRLDTGKAILFLRKRVENDTYYKHLREIKKDKRADLFTCAGLLGYWASRPHLLTLA